MRGNVTLDLGAGNDVVDFGATGPLGTVQFAVGGNLHVRAGDGNDTLNFIDIRVGGSRIDVDTGRGNDELYLNRVDAARARLLADLGDGEDVFEVDDHSQLSLERLRVDGEHGVDQLKPGNLLPYGFRRKLRSFEG